MRQIFTFLFLFVGSFSIGQVSFVDMSEGSGIDHLGKTWGSSWGDFNGDGLLDLYISNHYNRVDDSLGGIYLQDVPEIFINLGNNMFLNMDYIINPLDGNDLHGSLIFDFDNDGDDDLLITSGGSTRNLFFVNDGTSTFTLENLSETFGIDLFGGRGRMASVIDLDQNGIADVVLSNLQNSDGTAPTSVYTRQEDEVFENVNLEANFSVPVASHGTLMDMNGDGIAEFVLMVGNRFKIYDFQTEEFIEESEITIAGNTTDYILGDFNGDLLTDAFFTRAHKNSDIVLKNDHTIQALMQNGPPDYHLTSFTFESSDSIEISIRGRVPIQYNFTIHLGNNDVQNVTGYQSLIIHPNQSIYQGFQDVEDSQENTHIFIGRVDGKWKVQSSNFTFDSEIGITVKGHSEILNFEASFEAESSSNLDNLHMNQGNFQFMPQGMSVLQESDNSRMGVVGDFDNDMDLDIYVVCGTGALNTPNYLLENVNNVTWTRHSEAWGANGDGDGIGESVTVADINNDGFLDLFVGNGMSVFFLEEAKYNLYTNEGNDNNWLGIKLIGETATKGGYGAVVYAVAGGVKQVRTQNGGEHHRCQNDQRILFGMAQNMVVDSVIVKWPCGSTQILLNVPVNQYLEIVEEECVLDLDVSVNQENYLEIFPNPTFEWFRISSNYNGEATIKIFDISGKKVDEINHFFSDNMDISHQLKLQPGVYLVEFLPKSQALQFHRTLKLVVQ